MWGGKLGSNWELGQGSLSTGNMVVVAAAAPPPVQAGWDRRFLGRVHSVLG
jgi:hypothetical protein